MQQRASRTSGSEAEEEQSLVVREELIRLLKRASVMVEDPPYSFFTIYLGRLYAPLSFLCQ